MTVLMFVAGLVLLIAGAECLVRGASRLALSLGISPLVVGLTVVAFGTSAPEVAVSVGAALESRTDMALGNVVGSNIFNVLFILGIAALLSPLIVNLQIIRQEVPIMIGASVLTLLLGMDGTISFFDAALLFGLLLVYTAFLVVQSRRATKESSKEFDTSLQSKSSWDAHWAVQIALVIAGLVLLVLGADWLVEAATTFARALGVSDLVIALTIVAAGTSMPELATSIMAALRKERDIAVGNVIGSCTFNLLGCLGLAGMVAPGGLAVPASLLAFDIWVMLVVALACLPIFVTGREISRWEGAVFLGYYAAYTAYLILATQQHDALPGFSNTMLAFVIPLTVVTLIVVMMKPKRGS